MMRLKRNDGDTEAWGKAGDSKGNWKEALHNTRHGVRGEDWTPTTRALTARTLARGQWSLQKGTVINDGLRTVWAVLTAAGTSPTYSDFTAHAHIALDLVLS